MSKDNIGQKEKKKNIYYEEKKKKKILKSNIIIRFLYIEVCTILIAISIYKTERGKWLLLPI